MARLQRCHSLHQHQPVVDGDAVQINEEEASRVVHGQKGCFSDNSPLQDASVEGLEHVQNGMFACRKFHHI